MKKFGETGPCPVELEKIKGKGERDAQTVR
jgi:hypothetical protein